MIRKDLFFTTIYSKVLNLDLNDLLHEINVFRSVQTSKSFSNYGGYQAHNFNYQPLTDAIASNVPLREDKPEIKVKMEFWVNVNNYGDYNIIHNHSPHEGTFLSGVFYVKTPSNSGRIRFYDPRSFIVDAPDMRYYNDSSSFYYYNPEPNLLILFPGWLYHDVEPSKSHEERISIAFNLIQQQ